MNQISCTILIAAVLLVTSVSCAALTPLVIGHRGASGYRPEHTLESYRLAIDQGADYIEPDLVSTKDGVLVARHENEIGETTDAALKFPNRKATKVVDGQTITGYFVEDFTFQELRTLRAKERLPSRDHAYDGRFLVPTFNEVLDLATQFGVGVYPETKHPSYFRSIGLALEPKVAEILKKRGLDKRDSLLILQSFELSSLERLKSLGINSKMVFLIDELHMRPYDHILANDPRTYGDMVELSALTEISSWIYGIGPWKRLILQDVQGKLVLDRSILENAHSVGLKVHVYTFRSDAEFLHSEYKGDPAAEYRQFKETGIDGFFSDFPDQAVRALK